MAIPSAILYIKGIAMRHRYAGTASVRSSKSTFTIADTIRNPTKISAGAVAKPGIAVKIGAKPRAILAGDYDRAKQTALWYRDLFGEGNYYIELQDHGLEEDRVVLPQLIRLARETGIPMAATNDAHYITKEDAKMQSILLCIQTGKTINDVDRMEFQTDEFYLKSTDEMYELFSMVPEACENTNKIAEQCNFAFTFGETKLP